MPRITIEPDEEYPFYRSSLVDGDRHGIEISDAEWAEIEQGYAAYEKLQEKLGDLHERLEAAEPIAPGELGALVRACRAAADRLRTDFSFEFLPKNSVLTPPELRNLILAYPGGLPGPMDPLRKKFERDVVVERDAKNPDLLTVMVDHTPIIQVRIERLEAWDGPRVTVTTVTLGAWHNDRPWSDKATEYTRQLAERVLVRLREKLPDGVLPTTSSFRSELLFVVHTVDRWGDFADRMDREVVVTLDPAASNGVSVTRRRAGSEAQDG